MPKILIVDDRRDAIEVLQAKLQKRGFVTEASTDAREIPRICEAQGIDAIVMDMNMPELDGCEATEFLKSNPATATIPVIMCTAHPLAGDRERAERSGCDGFVEKPIHLKPLLQILGQFFEVGPEEAEDAQLEKPEDRDGSQTTDIDSAVAHAATKSGELIRVDSPAEPPTSAAMKSQRYQSQSGKPAAANFMNADTSRDSR